MKKNEEPVKNTDRPVKRKKGRPMKRRPVKKTPKKSNLQIKRETTHRIYDPIFEKLSFDYVMLRLAVLLVPFAVGRKALARQSIMFFAWYYLNIKLTVHQCRWFRMMIKKDRFLTIAPRGHGKSELVSYILPFWLIVNNRNVRILILTLSKDLACKHVIRIKDQLESRNTKVIRDYGDFYHIKRVAMWRQDSFAVIRTIDVKDPTLEGAGIDSKITGSHFDYIICDDLIDDDCINSATIMKGTEDKFKGTITPLIEDKDGHIGKIWAIGTRKHFDDIYNWMLENPVYDHVVEPAIIRWPRDYTIQKLDSPIELPDGNLQHFIVTLSEEDPGKVLWPEKFTMERLLLIRYELGSIMFAREYQGEPQDDETALFKHGWLEACRTKSKSYILGDLPESIRRDYQLIMTGADLSLVTDKRTAEKGDTDYMVQVALGLRRFEVGSDYYDGYTRDLLAIDRDRGLSPSDKEGRVKTFYNRIQPYRAAIEDNAFATIHIHNLLKNDKLNILKHHTGKTNKNNSGEGIPHLSAIIENGHLRLPDATEYDKKLTQTLIDELHAYPFGKHDDQVLALWIAESAILRWMRAQARIRKMKYKYQNNKSEVV